MGRPAFLLGRTRSLFLAVSAAVLVLVIAAVFYSFYAHSMATNREYAVKNASLRAARIEQEFANMETILRVFTAGVEEMRRSGHTDRDAVIEIQKDILDMYPAIFGINVVYEPNRYDGRDAQYRGHPVYLDKGIFFPYVWRRGSGYAVEYTFTGDGDEKWYTDYRKNPRVLIDGPSPYSIGGEPVEVVSISYPIMDGGEFIGAACFDCLASLFADLLVKGGERAFLVSNNGEIIASTFPAYADGDRVSDDDPWRASIASALEGRSSSAFLRRGGDSFLAAFTPAALLQKDAWWCYAVVLDRGEILSGFSLSLAVFFAVLLLISLVYALLVLVTRVSARRASDALTGLYNRFFIDHMLPRFVQNAGRKGAAFCLVMCDLDNFKKVNDTYGHSAGDDVIRAFASVAGGAIRANKDWAARYGGEEFLLYLDGTDRAGGVRVVERMLQGIRAAEVAVDGGRIRFTVSCGLASSEGRASLSAADLLKTADENLYTAKKTGKDRVVAG